jgi:inosine-uridine nucleoside N-ribohydrolase
MRSRGKLPFIVVALLLSSLAGQASGQEKVILDDDFGSFSPTLIMLLHSAQVEVLGATVVAGNSWVETETASVTTLMQRLGRSDIPIIAGAGEPLMGNRQPWYTHEERLFGNAEYLGALSRPRPEPLKPGKENAVDFIVRKVKEFPNQVTLLATGPATNIALAVKTHPEIVPLVKRIIYMGGAIDMPGNTTPAAEFNFWFDPEAIKIALRTPFKEQIVVPDDICERVFYTKAIYDRIAAAPETTVVKMFRERQGPMFQTDPKRQTFIWDELAAAILLKPEIATKIEERYIDIDVNYGPNYGRSIGYHESRRRSLSNPENFPAGTQKVKIVFDIDREAFWDLFVGLMTKPDRPSGSTPKDR